MLGGIRPTDSKYTDLRAVVMLVRKVNRLGTNCNLAKSRDLVGKERVCDWRNVINDIGSHPPNVDSIVVVFVKQVSNNSDYLAHDHDFSA